MGDDKVQKLQKLHKARLVEAVLTCIIIRAAKMMLQGISYSQVVQAQAPVHIAPAPTLAPASALAPAPLVVRTALTPDKAIAIFLETIGRLQLR
jgi:hypothetical protein